MLSSGAERSETIGRSDLGDRAGSSGTNDVDGNEINAMTAIAELRALSTLGLTVRVFSKTNDSLLADI